MLPSTNMDTELFSHRQLSDGSVQSVCMCCFFTVAFGKNEADLAKGEAMHACPQRLAMMAEERAAVRSNHPGKR